MSGRDQWEAPPADLALSDDDVHVWRASLGCPAECVQPLAQTLSGDERLRAERFRFERDRLRFIVGRGLLRVILGRYVGVEPGQLQFRYDTWGKPSLAETSGGCKLGFSLAHSHGLALYAIARSQGIGADLEYVRPLAEVDGIVDRVFSPRERAAFRALPVAQRQEAFFRYWTCKEAYLKARGYGLSWPPDKVEVDLVPGEPARLWGIGGDRQTASGWSVEDLAPAPGYAAAVAIQGHGWRLRHWDFDVSREVIWQTDQRV